MSPACPNCKKDDVQLLSDVFLSGVSDVTFETVGIAPERSASRLFRVKRPEAAGRINISQLVAPPEKSSYFRILGCWFISTLVVTFRPTVVGTFIGYAVLIAAGIALHRAHSFNQKQWPLLFQKWERSYICLGCGNIFEPTTGKRG